MGGNLWIGQPGALREIRQRADVDRSLAIGGKEYTSLEGHVTRWRPPHLPRRLKFSWKNLDQEDACFLEKLARKLHLKEYSSPFPGSPLAIVDPTAQNIMTHLHAQAGVFVPAPMPPNYSDLWKVDGAGSIGNFVYAITGSVLAGSIVSWHLPGKEGWPTQSDMTLTFCIDEHPSADLFAPQNEIGIQWLDFSGDILSTTKRSMSSGGHITATAPPGSCFARPIVVVAEASQTVVIGRASLTVGEKFDLSAPGVGCPDYEMVSFKHSISHGNYHDITIEVVEVTSAA